jgi:hypothetical protein
MIRAYLELWDKVRKPIHPEVVTAVRKALAVKTRGAGSIRNQYHMEFLKHTPTPALP